MQTDNVLVIQPRTLEKLNALKSFLSAFNLDYEVQKPYKVDFVEKIQKSRQEFEDGKFKRVQKEDLKSFLGL
jgi:hypothetical protein